MEQGWGQVQLTKYSSTPSTPTIYQVQYWSSTHFFKKYLSTSSTFIPSTSTHIKICSKVRMDIQSRVNFGWTKQKDFPKSCLLKSQYGYILWRVDFGLTNWSVFVQNWRWPYSMQSKFGMDKVQGSYKLEWLYSYTASGYIFTSSKRVTDYL